MLVGTVANPCFFARRPGPEALRAILDALTLTITAVAIVATSSLSGMADAFWLVASRWQSQLRESSRHATRR